MCIRDSTSIAAYENVIDELAELFDVSRQAAKVRLMDLGYSKAEGAYPFVDGQYVRGYSFEAGALDKNQTFTIPYAEDVYKRQELLQSLLSCCAYLLFVQ